MTTRPARASADDIQIRRDPASGSSEPSMLLIGVAWIYVVLMVVLAQATGPDASWLAALGTLLFWGVLPLGIVGYLALAPARRRRRRGTEADPSASASIGPRVTTGIRSGGGPAADPGDGGHPAGDAVAPEGKKT